MKKDKMGENERPWGNYEVLSDEMDHKVKRVIVYPMQRLSLQRHQHRNEHWLIVHGDAVVICNEREIHLQSGESIDIPCGAFHRIFNPGKENMIFIEIQTGDYFEEDDIERIEDDYGRI
jgi:mannose-6-phosphate isomerase